MSTADGHDASPSTGPRYTVTAVARRLGVAPATLRTWARRYDLGPAEHDAGAHRRYSEGDVARLQAVRRLVQSGVTPAEAARLVRAGDVAVDVEPPRTGGASLSWTGPDDPASEVRGLLRASWALDGDAVVGGLRAALGRDGVVVTWQRLLLPLLQAVGERWAATGEGVDVEHLLSECAMTALRGHVPASAEPAVTRLVLLACTGGERHCLPLSALASALAEQGVPSRILGADVPPEALGAAVRRIGPASVFLWSSLPRTGDVDALEALPTTRPPAHLVVGGPGWPAELPRAARRVHDLPGAVDELVALTR